MTNARIATETIRGKKSLRKERRNQSEMINAISIPTSGAITIKTAVLMIGSLLIAPQPPYATAAPAKPPIKVCEEEEGIPNHQVSKFQMIAAINPEKMTIIICSLVTLSA